MQAHTGDDGSAPCAVPVQKVREDVPVPRGSGEGGDAGG